MSNSKDCDSELWDVLAKEHLVDLSQFHEMKFFDEVPLYSRDSEIDFLSRYPIDRANSILIGFALKYLKSVVHYEEHRSQYLAAITVWNAEDDYLVPNLFVWSGSVRVLQKKLTLEAVRTPFAKKIRQIVSEKHSQNGFEVLEDASTDPNETRVFISLSKPPYKSFVPLSMLIRHNNRFENIKK